MDHHRRVSAMRARVCGLPIGMFAVALLIGCADREPLPTATIDQVAPLHESTTVAASAPTELPLQQRTPAKASPLAIAPKADRSLTEVVRLALPYTRQAKGYAYDPQTGDLAIIGPWQDQLAIVSLEGQVKSGPLKNIELVKLLGAPSQLIHQARSNGGMFAVSQTNPNGVLIVDVQSREVVKKIKIDGKPASFVPASGPAAPYLFFTSSDRQGDGEMFGSPGAGFHMPSGSTIEIQRLNIETIELEAPLHVATLNNAGHAVFGDLTLYYWRGSISPVVHPRFRFTFQGNRVYDADLTRELSVLKCAAKSFLNDGPWVVGVTRDELVVCSINDGRIVAGVQIPSGYHRVASVFLDAERGYIVVGLGSHVVLVPLDKLVLPDEPVLVFEEVPLTYANLRETYEFPLTTVSGNPTIELVEGPEGMKIEGGILRWRPETAYTGPLDVKLKVTAGEAVREQNWQITVQ